MSLKKVNGKQEGWFAESVCNLCFDVKDCLTYYTIDDEYIISNICIDCMKKYISKKEPRINLLGRIGINYDLSFDFNEKDDIKDLNLSCEDMINKFKEKPTWLQKTILLFNEERNLTIFGGTEPLSGDHKIKYYEWKERLDKLREEIKSDEEFIEYCKINNIECGLNDF